MSERSIVEFAEGGTTVARVYHFTGGHGGAVGWELEFFFKALEAQTSDPRYDMPFALAAKYVVWAAARLSDPEAPLDFFGLGVLVEGGRAEEFIYRVDCSNLDKDGRPTITCRDRRDPDS